MTRQVRSELQKLRSTRTNAGLLLGLLALVAFTVVVQLVAQRFEDAGISQLDDPETQRTIFTTASVAGLFALLVGVLSVTGEFRHGTIRPTLLFTPVREIVMAAKGVACALVGVGLGGLAVALTFVIAVVWLGVDGVPRRLDTGELAGIAAGTVAGALLWAAIGVGVGAVVRNQVAAVVGAIVWTMLPEPLLQALAPDVGRLMPGPATDALVGASGQDLLSPLAGLVVLLLWTAGWTAAGVVVTARRDVP